MLTNRARMDAVTAAAERQGFRVWQTQTGAWMFRTGNITVYCKETPQTGRQWSDLLADLIRVGLVWPPPEWL